MKKFKSFALVFAIMLFATGIGLLFGTSNLASTQAKVEADSTPSETWYTDWKYTKNDNDKTISLTSYTGSETNYVIPATATIDGVTYSVIYGNGVFDIDNATSQVELNTIEDLKFQNGVKFPDNCSGLFYEVGTYNEGLHDLDLSTIDTSNVIDMSYMFAGNDSIHFYDLSSFNTAKVTNMSHMFDGVRNVYFMDLSKNFGCPEADGATNDMSYMFNNFQMDEYAADIDVLVTTKGRYLANLNTTKTTNMSYMFSSCNFSSKLNKLFANSIFNTGNVTNMSYMFSQNGGSLTELDISTFNLDKVTNMAGMFADNSTLTNIKFPSKFGCPSAKDATNDMNGMFKSCTALTNLDLSNFDTSKVIDMQYMFNFCYNLKTLDLSNFDVSNVTNMDSIFSDCNALTTINLSNFRTSNVTNMYRMFYQCNSLVNLDLSSFNTKKVTNMEYMFGNLKKLETLDLSGFEISSGTDVNHIFEDVDFGGLESIQTVISPNKIASDVTMEVPFVGLGKAIVFKDENGTVYDHMPEGKITLYASEPTYFKFITTRLDKDAGVYEITAMDNGVDGEFELYKNDKYLAIPESGSLMLLKYIGTGTNIIIPAKMTFVLDPKILQDETTTVDDTATVLQTTTSVAIYGEIFSYDFFGAQANKITSLTFGTENADDCVQVLGLVETVNKLESLQTLDITKCIFMDTTDFITEDDAKSILTGDMVGMTKQEDIDAFFKIQTSKGRKQYLINWMKNNVVGDGDNYLYTEEAFDQLQNNFQAQMDIFMCCFVPETGLKYSIKTIKMPANSWSTQEITLNGDYTYGDGQKTNKFIYGGETLNYVEGTGSAVDGPSTPSTPSTGVVLDVVLPVVSISVVLASLCAVAFVGKKKKQY